MVSERRLRTVTICILGLILAASAVWYWNYLRLAHSSFENYFAFRGCSELVEKTDTYGTCKTGSGQMQKIVLYRGRWYLDGDLPWACLGKVCFGM